MKANRRKPKNKRKQMLAILLVLAMLCTSSPFAQIRFAHASETGQHTPWYCITANITAAWGGHIAGEVILKNTSSQTRSDWQIRLPWQAQITSMWNGRYQATKQGCLIQPVEYNSDIAPGSSITIGFLAEGEDNELQTLTSEHFFTQDGAEITDALDRAAGLPDPQEPPTPVLGNNPDATPFQEPVGTYGAAETATPDITGQPGTTAIPVITPTPEPTETPAAEPATPEPTETPAAEPATPEPTGTPAAEPATPEPTETPAAETALPDITGQPETTAIPVITPTPEPTGIPAAEPATPEPTETPAAEPATPEPTETPAAETALPDITGQPETTAIPVITPTPEPTETPQPDHPDSYFTSAVTLQGDTICGSLYLLDGGSVNLNGYTLTVQKDLWIQAGSRGILGGGKLCLGGNLTQSSSAEADSFCLENSVQFVLCGSQLQEICLAHPQTSRLGQLDLSESAGAVLPGEIHAGTVRGLEKAELPEQLRLQISHLSLDSDVEIPGDLTLLGGSIQTGSHRLAIRRDLQMQGPQQSSLQTEGGAIEIHGITQVTKGILRADQGGMISAKGDITINSGNLMLYGGTIETQGNLTLQKTAVTTLWGGYLKIHGDWKIHASLTSPDFSYGIIELYGDMIQYQDESSPIIEFVRDIRLILKGTEPQQIRLANPEQSTFGQLDLSGCQEASLPDEIHSYSLAGIRNLHMGEQLRLRIVRLQLDSDVEIPGNLTLLGGVYQTGRHHLAIRGDLQMQGSQYSTLQTEGGSINIQGNIQVERGVLQVDQDGILKSVGDIKIQNGNLKIYGGTIETQGNLILQKAAVTTLWGGFLKIHKTWEFHNTLQNPDFYQGTIELHGDMVQYQEETSDTVEFTRDIRLALLGNATQHVRLANLEQSSLGLLDIQGSAGVVFQNWEDSDESTRITGNRLDGAEKIRNIGGLELEFGVISLKDDLDYYGDLQCHGTLELNQHDLTVHGNLETDSSINNPGTLDIHGNCILAGGIASPGMGTIRVRENLRLRDDAALAITEPAGKLLVEGDLKTSASGVSDLCAGTIELKGNLTCTRSATSSNMGMTGTTLVLSGQKKQILDLYAGKSCAKVERVDLNQATSVYITGDLLNAKYVKGFEKITNKNLIIIGLTEILEQDEYFHGSLQILGELLECNGYRFILDGGLELSGTVCKINRGMLSVGGNFGMYGTSVLCMTQSQDRLVIQKSFHTVSTLSHSGMLTDGRMILGGNFHQEGDAYSFDSSENFTVAFVSINKQYVRFEHPETSQIANTEGDYIKDYSTEEKVYQVVDAVSYGIADGLGELLESPIELLSATAGAAITTLGVTLGLPGVGGVALILGIGDCLKLLIDTYKEISEIDNELERLRVATKEVTKLVVFSAVMKVGEKVGDKAGEYIADKELWQKCCKLFHKKNKADITREDIKKIAMTTAEHLESISGCMDAEVFDSLLRYQNKYAEVDAMEVAEMIQTIYSRTGKALEIPDIKILYQRLADDAEADIIYHILAVTERFNKSDDFHQNFELEVGKDTSLSLEEKIWKLQKGYQNVADQTDVMIPADPRYVKGFDENGYAIYKWPKYLGFVRNTIRSVTRENGLPDMMDRYGRNTGSNFAALPAGGKYAYDLRSIPYLENEMSYHKFNVKYKENYFDKIDAIREGNFKKLNEIISSEKSDLITEEDFINIKRDYDKKINSMKSENGITEDITYGLKGIVAKYNNRTPELPGGAEQYTLPLSAKSLKQIGVLEE